MPPKGYTVSAATRKKISKALKGRQKVRTTNWDAESKESFRNDVPVGTIYIDDKMYFAPVPVIDSYRELAYQNGINSGAKMVVYGREYKVPESIAQFFLELKDREDKLLRQMSIIKAALEF